MDYNTHAEARFLGRVNRRDQRLLARQRPGEGAVQYMANRFSVTRQLRYSRDETPLALDLGLFITAYRSPPSSA